MNGVSFPTAENKKTPRSERLSIVSRAYAERSDRLITVTVLIEIAWLVARMIMVLASRLRVRRVAMPMLVEITGLVTGMVVMLAWRFLGRLVAMTVVVEISRRMARMVVVRAGFFVWHVDLPFEVIQKPQAGFACSP